MAERSVDFLELAFDPRLAAGMLLSVQALMKRLDLTEVLLKFPDDVDHGKGISVGYDAEAATMSFKIKPMEG